MDGYHFLYKITNMNNGKFYIGQTMQPERRWYLHKWFGQNPEKSGQAISYAIAKHGKDAFHFQVITTCKTYEDANVTEAELIKQYDCHISNHKGYNETLGGNNSPWTQERKEHMSKLMSGENNPFFGKTHSPEAVEKMSTAKKGKPSKGKMTQKCLDAALIANTGRKQSTETLAKRFSPEARLKMSLAAKNRKK